MLKRVFITGTDTGVGKTLVATALLDKAAAQGLATVACKPVAAGCRRAAGQWVNADALALQAAATTELEYQQVNPVALEPPIAPHIAAREAGVSLHAKQLVEHINALPEADFLLIEGAGGWLVPLNETETLADLCVALDTAVIMVVAIKLGCLNHAMLTAAAIQASGVELLGWVGNCLEPSMPMLEANLSTLHDRMMAPCLGVIPYLEPGSGSTAASALDFTVLSSHRR